MHCRYITSCPPFPLQCSIQQSLPCVRHCKLTSKGADGPAIATNDQLVEEEIELVRQHLFADGSVPPEPAVGLFGCGGIEVPFAIVRLKLRKGRGVAIVHTEVIGLAMLAIEVEDVNGKGGVLKEGIVTGDLKDFAIRVVENTLGECAVMLIDPLDELL